LQSKVFLRIHHQIMIRTYVNTKFDRTAFLATCLYVITIYIYIVYFVQSRPDRCKKEKKEIFKLKTLL